MALCCFPIRSYTRSARAPTEGRRVWRLPANPSVSQRILANGLPVVEMPIAGRGATTIVLALPAGARHEREEEVGVAHVLEHMAFKGSERYRTATELNRAAAYLGTELDGLATNEYVEFSCVVRSQSAMAAADLLSEVAGRPLLTEEHFHAERSVILQEIADDAEDPASRAEDRLIAALFGSHRLGKSVTGHAVDVERLTRQQALAFHERQWSPERGVLVLAGNLEDIDRPQLEDYFMRLAERPAPAPPQPLGAFQRQVEVEERDGEVVHLRLAYAVPAFDLTLGERRAAAEVYSDLLGGPAGSRLFDELREQRSLCYWIDGYLWGYDHASFLSVDCSIKAADLPEVCERIDAIVGDLAANGPTEEEVARARSYATGSAALTFESVGACADHAVELIIEYGDHDVTPARYLAALERVTRADICELAARVAPGPCVGCVGPVGATAFG